MHITSSTLTLVVLSATALLAQTPAPAELSSTTVQAPGLRCTTDFGAGTFRSASWTLGASNSTSSTSGRPIVSDVSVQKLFDACSAALFQQVATGVRVGNVTLTQNEKDNKPALTVQLQNAIVVAYQLGSTDSSPLPVEQVSFRYDRITITHVATGNHSCWDTKTNASCN